MAGPTSLKDARESPSAALQMECQVQVQYMPKGVVCNPSACGLHTGVSNPLPRIALTTEH